MRAAADHHEPHGGIAAREPRGRLEQQLEAAMALRARDDADHAVLGRETERLAHRLVGRRGREAREIDRAVDRRDGPPAAQPAVRGGRRLRNARERVGAGPEQPAVPGPGRDRLGELVRAHDPRAALRARSRARARSASTWSRVCQVCTTSNARCCEQRAQPSGVGAIAQRPDAARALELEHGREAGLARARAQRRLALGRRGRARERDVVTRGALRGGELEHRRGGPGPLPVARELEDPQG